MISDILGGSMMAQKLILAVVAAVVVCVCSAAVVLAWTAMGPTVPIDVRTPGRDRTASTTAGPTSREALAAEAVPGPGRPADDLRGLWPGFRGPNRDNISDDDSFLATRFAPGGPKVLWKIDVGEGYAGPAVRNGRVYLHDYDRAGGRRRNGADAIRCLSLADGAEIWRYVYPVRIKRFHGMTRTVPAVTDRHVVALGPKGHVTCLDATTGRLRWQIDLVTEYGTKIPPWYAGQCPLVDGDLAIIAPAGPDVLMIAVDCATGQVRWKAPNTPGWKMTHSSIMPVTFEGQKMYVYCADRGVVGVSADTGAILWRSDAWRIKIANIPSPVSLGRGRIFLTGGYSAGSCMLRLKMRNEKFAVDLQFRLPAETFGSMQQTPIFYEGYLYGIAADGQLTCLTPSGKVLWRSGTSERFGLGPMLISRQGLLYALSDDGVLTIARASPTAYDRLARVKVLDGHEAWGPMALAGGRLIVRDLTTMVCLDVTE